MLNTPPRTNFVALLTERYSERLTDLGNAQHFSALYAPTLRYVPDWGWLIWDGMRWHLDDTDQVLTLTQAFIHSIYEEAASLPPEQRKLCKALLLHARRCSTLRHLRLMLDLARRQPDLVASPATFDSHPFLLNVLNGTLNLQTGQLQSHDPRNFLTRLVPIAYELSASSPLWENFLSTITNHDPALQRYLQCAIGYTLTSSTREEALFFLHGAGCNGKTLFLEAISSILGDYAQPASARLILQNPTPSSSTPLPFALIGARLAKISELQSGCSLASHALKQLTSAEIVDTSAGSLALSSLLPRFKLWIATNHLPKVPDLTYATWRRLKVIPFTVSFAGHEEKDLRERLKLEAPAILVWAVQGCLLWQREGLQQPPSIEKAILYYRYEQDELADFLLSCCTLAPDLRVGASELYQAYQEWNQANTKNKPMSTTLFGRQLSAHGYCREHKMYGAVYIGLSLRSLQDRLDELQSMSPDILKRLSKTIPL